jgi:hypothetical protein
VFLTTLNQKCSALICPNVRSSGIYRPIQLSDKLRPTRPRLRKPDSVQPHLVQELLATWIVLVSRPRHRIGKVEA